ncbi:beta-ketoacyl synthase N-terminal-like domain-containing protein [Aliivibrio sp. S4MY1]|uniref:beta-ketoacyl synthase N-terminal-like domain-containing protein n=2 Tax=Aliivibrio TaxID=511678 RepID=UPI0023788C11|nr:beta-ketoacyl synthase N-terminal-like domain-containing protein [Aliivibrio sp. S4MY1]MDD9201306.1 beta-ketoacyl synthase N-terminal-like domain-containing protein [Aliivibrio sp. S4MY1]
MTMITLLGGEVLSALGNKTQQLNLMKAGKYLTVDKSVNVFEQVKTLPYYAIQNDGNFETLFDPIPHLKVLIASLLEQHNLSAQERGRCGLFIGCAANDISLMIPLGNSIKDGNSPQFSDGRVGNGVYADKLANAFGLNSLSLTYNTACTSSSNAILDAATMIEAGVIDYALVVGMEMFAPHSFEGFVSMQLLAEQQTKPFDANRDGLLLGESLSVVLMSRDDVKASPWHFRGGCSQCETHSVTGVNPDGSGVTQVIKQALQNSDVSLDEITAVKAHGTASHLSDLAEINGMKEVFSQAPLFFSLKPYIGHTLGACGVSELVIMMNAIDNGFIPKTPNFEAQDDELQWIPTQELNSCNSGVFLLNCFGFGGNNNALVVERKSV